jgi:hypothetical protein
MKKLWTRMDEWEEVEMKRQSDLRETVCSSRRGKERSPIADTNICTVRCRANDVRMDFSDPEVSGLWFISN